MYNNKIAKKMNRNQTIDLKYINSKEYCNKIEKEWRKQMFFDNVWKIVFSLWIIWALFLSLHILTPQISFGASNEQEMSIRDKIRQERLEVCQKAYKNSWISEKFIYKQLPVVRCATYMWLIYAYESNFWKSRKCLEDKNCHWMKWNWVDTPQGFLKFETFKEWREYFAKKYFRFHYKKNINTFVNNWSMTDRKTYKSFMKKRFWKMYWELEYFYLTWRNK